MQKSLLTTVLALGIAAASLTSCSRANYAFNPATPAYLGSARVHAAAPVAPAVEASQATAAVGATAPVVVATEAHQAAAVLARRAAKPAVVAQPVQVTAPAKVAAKLTRADKQTLKRELAAVKAPAAEGKSQVVALILSFFLGGLGIDRFYLGYTGIGILKLLTFGVFGILALIGFIRILIGDLKPKGGEYTTKL